MNDLEKLQKCIRIYEKESTQENLQQLLKTEKEYLNIIKKLENQYDIAKTIEKNKINKEIQDLTDHNILFFD